MVRIIEQFLPTRYEARLYALSACMLLFVILGAHQDVFVFRGVDTAATIVLAALIGWYRPLWAWTFFFMVLACEALSIAPETAGLAVRPYQALSVILIAVTVGKDPHILTRLWQTRSRSDVIVIAFVLWGALMTLLQGSVAGALMVASFLVPYVAVRLFVLGEAQAWRVITTSSVIGASIVAVYALVQNWLWVHGSAVHGEVMPGRPQATFTEPAWLAFYLGMAVVVVMTLMIERRQLQRTVAARSTLYAVAVLLLSAIIVAAARSTWLAVAAAAGMLCFLLWRRYGLRYALQQGAVIGALVVVAIGIVRMGQLTTVELGNRLQSTATGQQGITLACANNDIPDGVLSPAQALAYKCTHIALEEIPLYKLQNYVITRGVRPDPNIEIRKATYERTRTAIAQRPLTGHGWGSSARILGNDPAGTPLNASNLFYEIVLSSGVIGLLLFATAAFYGLRSIARQMRDEYNLQAVVLVATAVVFGVVQTFNAGLLMGFVWVWLSLLLYYKKKST